jgi:aminoglycoside phosphotransferase (APT) family kinase protein
MSREPVEFPGWDSHAEIVDGTYVERFPRRPDVRDRLERECRILPVIAPLLPLPVPVPVVVVPTDASEPWRVRHTMVPGDAADPDELTDADGETIGSFLRALHDLPLPQLGLDLAPDDDLVPTIARMERDVLPLVDPALRQAGAALLARVLRPTPLVFAHRDLGPAHVLVADGSVSGVIDWTDACLADPAMDLAWALHGTPAGFRDGVLRMYKPDAEERGRSLDWHRLGPWHEVLWGLGQGGREYVGSGLDGVHQRLFGESDVTVT